MYEFDLSSLGAYIQTILRLVGGGLRLDPEAFRQVYLATKNNYGILLWIVFMAGLSLMIGQSVVLFANRVPRGRFILSLVFGAVKFILDILVIVISVWGLANLLGAKPWPLGGVARAIALTSAPYWLSFLILIPYLGLILEKAFKIYVFLGLTVAIQTIFAMSFFNALLGALLSLAVSLVISYFIGRLFNPLSNTLSHLISGDLEYSSTKEIFEMFTSRNQASR